MAINGRTVGNPVLFQFISIDEKKKKIEERKNAKSKGDFALADKIRDELLSKGILIEDQKQKTIWKFK